MRRITLPSRCSRRRWLKTSTRCCLAGDVLDVDRAGPPAIVLLLRSVRAAWRPRDSGLLGGRHGRCARQLAAQRHAAGQRARLSDRPRGDAGPGAGERVIARVQGMSCRDRRPDRSQRFSSRRARAVHDRRRLRHRRFGRPRGRSRSLHGTRRPASVSNGRRGAGRRPLLRHAARPRADRNRSARLHARACRRHGPSAATVCRHRFGSLDRADAGSHGDDQARATLRAARRPDGKAARQASGHRSASCGGRFTARGRW